LPAFAPSDSIEGKRLWHEPSARDTLSNHRTEHGEQPTLVAPLYSREIMLTSVIQDSVISDRCGEGSV
jgi:hypothetical protein